MISSCRWCWIGCLSMMYDSPVECSRVGDVLILFRFNQIWGKSSFKQGNWWIKDSFFCWIGRLFSVNIQVWKERWIFIVNLVGIRTPLVSESFQRCVFYVVDFWILMILANTSIAKLIVKCHSRILAFNYWRWWFIYQFLLLEMVIFVTNYDGPDDLNTEHDAIAAPVSLQK